MYEEVKTMGSKVGVVLDIDGQRLMYTRRNPSGRVGTYQAYEGMAVHLNDHFKTDPNTVATLEFLIGGRAVVSPDTELVVLGDREVSVVGNQIIIKAGKMWAKVDKQKSQLQIQTAGGVIGIEG
ncbi:MAG TPA: hypothetical protein VGV38_23460 [Pyrinomonadaceae bacterium]|nr:hypothetical protein [Pyrinomonadaceae bacterium]